MTDRLIYSCGTCGAVIVIESNDPQTVGQVYCDCTAVMDYEGIE